MKIGVLASGSGSNLQSIIDSCNSGYIPNSSVELVISNNEKAFALTRASNHGIKSNYIHPPDFIKYKKGMNIDEIMNDPLRREYDKLLVENFSNVNVEVICLAGYMLFVTPALLDKFTIINIHPSILPSFKGLHGIRDAINYGANVVGCTTHFVDNDEDTGPIILQATTPIFTGMSTEEISLLNLKREHIIFAETLRLYCKNLLRVKGRQVEIIWDKEHFEYQNKLLYLWKSDIDDYNNRR